MANTPAHCKKCFEKALNAWRTLRPQKKFLGLTVDQFEAELKPCLDIRDEITDLETKLDAARVTRNTKDVPGLELVSRFVNAIKADETEGENSELLETMGYIIKSKRKSGLHRIIPGSNTNALPEAA